MTLGKFLTLKHGGKVCSPDFGETTLTLSEFHDRLGLSDDSMDRQLLRGNVYTRDGQNGTQVYVETEGSDLMVCVLTDPTPVLFRKWSKREGGGVIAIMPRPEDRLTADSFEHVGQHGECRRSIIWKGTEPATEEEYAALKKELEDEPYNYRFRVIRRWPAR